MVEAYLTMTVDQLLDEARVTIMAARTRKGRGRKDAICYLHSLARMAVDREVLGFGDREPQGSRPIDSRGGR